MTAKEAASGAATNPITYVLAAVMLIAGAGGGIGGGAILTRQPVKIEGPVEVTVSGQDVMSAIARVEARLGEHGRQLGEISESNDKIASALSEVKTRVEVVAGTALRNEEDIKDMKNQIRLLERNPLGVAP